MAGENERVAKLEANYDNIKEDLTEIKETQHKSNNRIMAIEQTVDKRIGELEKTFQAFINQGKGAKIAIGAFLTLGAGGGILNIFKTFFQILPPK